MKHGWLRLASLLAAVPLLASCSEAKRLEKTYTLPTEPPAASGAPSAGEPRPTATVPVSGEQPVDELVTEPCDIHEVVQKYFTKDLLGTCTLEELAGDIGVECLRVNEGGTLYSVHEVEQGGRLYIFFGEEHLPIQWFYVRKRLSRADFAGIEAGASIEEVKKIDPTTQIFENIYNTDLEYYKIQGCISWHYLDDGILEIGYDMDKREVMALNFIDDYRIHRYDDSITTYYDGHIREEDWVA